MSKHVRGFGCKVSSAKLGSSLISPLQFYVLFHLATARWIPSVDSNHKALIKCDRTKSVLRLIQTSQFTSSSPVILVYIFLRDRPQSSVIGINAWMAGLPPACPFLMVSKHVTKFYKGHRGKRRQVFHPPPKRKC